MYVQYIVPRNAGPERAQKNKNKKIRKKFPCAYGRYMCMIVVDRTFLRPLCIVSYLRYSTCILPQHHPPILYRVIYVSEVHYIYVHT